MRASHDVRRQVIQIGVGGRNSIRQSLVQRAKLRHRHSTALSEFSASRVKTKQIRIYNLVTNQSQTWREV